MFVAGCGADQNPLPRRTVELAETYGNQLAEAVERVLREPMHPITGPLRSAYSEIDLAFGKLPSREEIEDESRSSALAKANRARKMLKTIETEGKLPSTYPYPIEAWRLGDLTWVFLGGEVVADYSLRIKRNLGSSHTWVSSYCNDVCAYIPSLRVLKEGGYEGATSMIYYGQPAPWSEHVEEQIIDALRKTLETASASGG
jgi:neutral ceramidase